VGAAGEPGFLLRNGTYADGDLDILNQGGVGDAGNSENFRLRIP
jgi:hypothetical protein